jgi:hypothetical protein
MVHVVGRQTQEDGSVSVPLDPETVEILKEQEKRFKEKFGRDMGPNDPIWFDPDCDTPTPIDDDKLREGTVEVLKKAGLRPELLYAYEKTGLIVASEHIYNHRLSPEDRADYDAAIDEYFAMNPREDDKE